MVMRIKLVIGEIAINNSPFFSLNLTGMNRAAGSLVSFIQTASAFANAILSNKF